jgi:hypothetical protein
MRVYFEKDGKFAVGVFLKEDDQANKESCDRYRKEMLAKGFTEIK